MGTNIANSIILRTIKPLLDDVFSTQTRPFRHATEALMCTTVSTGRPIIRNLAQELPRGNTSLKGMQERISGWLERYDFVGPIQDYLWRNAMSQLGQETIIALDSSDISKEFGGLGMEGMEKGYDASRDTTAMGHNILCASLVHRHRALPLCFNPLKGRHGLPKAEQALFNRIATDTHGKGIVVCDRGFDSDAFMSTTCAQKQRAVIRIKHLQRDLFGTRQAIDHAMVTAPAIRTTLTSPTNKTNAIVRWRQGFFPSNETHHPVLVVSSTFNDTTIYLYATNFIQENWTEETMRKAAILAANAYYNRWQIEVLFQDIKGAFAIEQARVRTFRRLTNLIAIATLAFVYFAHHLPLCSEATTKLLKLMKDNQQEVLLRFRTFVSNIRSLLALDHTRYITGRPRKEKPPDPTLFLPNFSF